MYVLREFFKTVYKKRICNDFDHVVLVIADEGMGKSTLILQAIRWWQQFRGVGQTEETILDRIAWTQDDFRDMMADADPRTAIAGMDAARILNKRKAQHGDQIEIVEDLFDVRGKEHLFLMGYQEWDSVPRTLQKRRAKNALYIPERGVIKGFNRESMDERYQDGDDEWPEPDMECRFPALDGEPLWQEFRQRDMKHKKERMRREQSENDDGEDEFDPRGVAQEVAENIEQYIARNPSNKVPYVNTDLIEVDYGLSHPDARKVKSIVEQTIDIERAADQQARAEGHS